MHMCEGDTNKHCGKYNDIGIVAEDIILSRVGMRYGDTKLTVISQNKQQFNETVVTR